MSDALILKRFLLDVEMFSVNRNRRGSLNEQDYPNFTVSSKQKFVNETTNSWLDYSDKIRSACREFTDNTRKICNLISQLDTLCTDQNTFNFIVCRTKDLLRTIERDAKLAQKELENLKTSSSTEKQVPDRVIVKKEVNRCILSTTKRSKEELTNDSWSIECDFPNSQPPNKDCVQVNCPEKEESNIFHFNDVDSLLTVKEELPDNESIFSQSTGRLGAEEEKDDIEFHEELDEIVENDKNSICSSTSLDTNNVSIDFAMMDTQQSNIKETGSNIATADTVDIQNSIGEGRIETANNLELCSDNSNTTIINPITCQENNSIHEGDSSQCIIRKDNCDQLIEEIKKPPVMDREIADINSNGLCIKRKALSQKEIAEQMKLLKSIYTISDIESTYDKSDLETSFSESEEEYETRQKTLKSTSAESKSKNHEYSMPDYLVYNSCYVKLTQKERELCDNFINTKSENQNINKRRHSTSSESSDTLLKPLKRRAIIFSSEESSSTLSNDGEKLLESDEEHNSFSLSLPSPNNLKDKNEAEENIDELAILNAIIDSDCFSSDDESSENEDNNVKKKKKVKANHKKQDIKEGSEWKMDSLLTGSLNETSDKLSATDNADENNMKIEIKDEDATEGVEDIFEILTDSSSSEIEFIDLIVNFKKAETGKTPGRKNIRALLSEDTLEQTTKQAEQAEKEHVERLKEKRKNMEKVLTDLKGTGLVLDASGTTRIEVNPLLSKRLKPHQISGVQFMWDACYETVEMIKNYPGAGCILAHCMGLGKTYQVVTLIHTLFKYPNATKTKQVLVVCPLSTVYNWKNEFAIALDISGEDTIQHIHIISDEQKSKTAKFLVVQEWHNTGGVLIMCYEAFVRFSLANVNDKSANAELVFKALVEPGPDLIICDEGHQLKNAKALRSKMLMKTNTKRRIILTGTPLQNNLGEYYHMVQFVKPNLLGTSKEYMNRFVNPIVNGQYDDSTDADIKLMKMRSYVLHYLLKNTIQRYEVTELEKYLPPKLDYVLFVRLHPVQVQLYKKYMENFKPHAALGKLFSHYTSLRPTWVHPYILYLNDLSKSSSKREPLTDVQTIGGVIHLDEEIEVPNEVPVGWWKMLTPHDFMINLDYGPKLKIMLSIIKECEKMNDQLLIFTQFLVDLDVIEKFLKLTDPSWKHGENYLRMDGKLGMEVRHKYCNKFNEPGSPIKIFLLTHKVGGLGLNFATANRVILMDVCWNPSYDTQSIYRMYRFGQIKPCYVYRLVSMGTMEEVAYERCVTKLAISGRVVDEKQISRHYKSTDLMSLYRCNLDISEERPTPKLPSDEVLARLLQIHKTEIYKYHEHQSLLENRLDEVLDENEIKLAWEQFNRENEPVKPPPQIPQNLAMPIFQQQDRNNMNHPIIPNIITASSPNILRNCSLNTSGSYLTTVRAPIIYPPTSGVQGAAVRPTCNIPSTSGNYSVNLPNPMRYTNKSSTSNVAVALPTKPGETLKRFDLKFVQNPDTGRDDIQLINTTKAYINNTNKQSTIMQPMSLNVARNNLTRKNPPNGTYMGVDITNSNNCTVQDNIVHSFIQNTPHNSFTFNGIPTNNQVIPNGERVPGSKGVFTQKRYKLYKIYKLRENDPINRQSH